MGSEFVYLAGQMYTLSAVTIRLNYFNNIKRTYGIVVLTRNCAQWRSPPPGEVGWPQDPQESSE